MPKDSVLGTVDYWLSCKGNEERLAGWKEKYGKVISVGILGYLVIYCTVSANMLQDLLVEDNKKQLDDVAYEKSICEACILNADDLGEDTYKEIVESDSARQTLVNNIYTKSGLSLSSEARVL